MGWSECEDCVFIATDDLVDCMCLHYLVHLSDQLVDIVFSVTKITALYVMLKFSRSPSTSWVRQLEWPEKVGGLERPLTTWQKKEGNFISPV